MREIELSWNFSFLWVGYFAQITVSGGDGPYSWSTSNSSLATITSNESSDDSDDSSAIIMARSEGNVRITATDSDGIKGSIVIGIFRQDDDSLVWLLTVD